MENDEVEIEGIEKKEFKVTDAEKEQLEHQRNVTERLIVNEIAYKFGVLIDSTYRNYCDALGKIEREVYSVMILKKRMDQNQVDIMKGATEQKFPDGRIKQLDDLKLDNLNINLTIDTGIDNIQALFVQIFKYVEVPRIDKSVFLTTDKYEKIVNKYSSMLKEKGIDVYRER